MAAHWNLVLLDDSPVTAFAADELQRLLGLMDESATFTTRRSAYDARVQEGLYVGRDAALDVPEVSDPALDDGIRIDVADCAGVVTGVNERSVLFAVYRLMTEAGCAFVRPGRAGEVVPRRDSAAIRVQVWETPAYRHRGICIEGGVSFENVGEMVDWLPKVGLNTYFTQFFRPYEFFDRWYTHHNNPLLTPTPVSPATVDQFLADYGAMLRQRGLLHHGVGHGWTARCLGLDVNGWYLTDNDAVDPQRRPWMALIDGQRRLFPGEDGDAARGVAINTNLCYSDPEARQALIDTIVAYCRTHREMDVVHIWLADTANNQCECEACQRTTPADLYVDMLNAVDAQLTALGLPTRLVFLLYLELLWPPVQARFRNPDRFILMFAPISRTYSQPYEVDASGAMVPYVRNHVTLPQSVGDSLAYLKAWQRIFSGDSFVYDYHYMWDHHYDLGGCALARILTQDIEHLHDIGLQGMISCQITRVFLPSGLGQYLLGLALWQGRVDFDAAADRYFEAAFGPDGAACRDYLETLSRLCLPPYSRKERPAVDPEAAASFAKLPGVVEAFLPTIRKHAEGLKDRAQALSWQYLLFHAGLVQRVAAFLLARATGDKAGMDAAWTDCVAYVRAIEPEVQPVHEAYEFIRTFGRLL